MRYLGIDYGSKRVGLALSDEAGTLSFPLQVLENNENLVSSILQVCESKQVGGVIVGESKDFAMKENAIMKDIKTFVLDFQKKSTLPITLHPEFLTSHQAEKSQGKHNLLDASAAAIILQSYLDTQSHTQS